MGKMRGFIAGMDIPVEIATPKAGGGKASKNLLNLLKMESYCPRPPTVMQWEDWAAVLATERKVLWAQLSEEDVLAMGICVGAASWTAGAEPFQLRECRKRIFPESRAALHPFQWGYAASTNIDLEIRIAGGLFELQTDPKHPLGLSHLEAAEAA